MNQVLHTDMELLLMERIADGDERAFEELFDIYVPRLYPVIETVVHSESAVKDVIQDVFLKLWVVRGTLREVQSPRDYIFRMTYNQSFKHLRKMLRQEKVQSKYHEREVNKNDLPDTPEELMDVAEARKLVEEAITLLPEQSRKIYQLSRHSGYRPQEIADHLGITVQSVRNSLARSGKQIKEHLSKKGIIIPLVLALWCIR
ncbi:MAG: RNA polymerase sigma-70 factor [Chitinophagaceae bacterium]|nr:RNA polymerase sigma-70 factor [Chitinophagaceae bacterium]